MRCSTKAIRGVAATTMLSAILCTAAEVEELPPLDAPYLQASEDPEVRVEDLLARMSREEKIGQLIQVPFGPNTVVNNVRAGSANVEIPASLLGSFIGATPFDVSRRNALQREVVEGSRLRIPAIFGFDVIHGFRTGFPVPLAQSCSFNPELVRLACGVAARESKLSGVDWTFAPMVDIPRDPRWGRITESFGEDPHVSSRFCVASVRGYQGDGYSSPHSIVSCLKHYIGYGASEAGIDYAATDLSEQALREFHLPPFQAGVDAGAGTVMSGFNTLNGVPASGNQRTLTGILRGELGFRGFVVSDYNSILQLGPKHARMTSDDRESARVALEAGVDMDMVDCLYAEHLPDLLAKGELAQETLDEAVRRILRVKFECGLFESPYSPDVPEAERYLRPNDLAIARELAGETFVLLKNDNSTLPLESDLGSVALVGPYAEDQHAMLGCWSAFCADKHAKEPSHRNAVVTIRRGLSEALPASCRLNYSSGKSIEEALEVAERSDVIVLCLGDNRNGENVSLMSLELENAGHQFELAEAMFATDKPVVLLLTLGRPMNVNRLVDKSDAVLAVWHPGSQGGAAVAEVLLGERSPSGKLSFTWQVHQGQIPIYYARQPSSRPRKEGEFWTSHYWDGPLAPLFPFGHGLSYSTFDYGDVKLSADQLSSNGELEASVRVTNRGPVAASETVMWYLAPSHGRVARPLKLLKKFEKQRLEVGESRVFRFQIRPDRDISYPDRSGGRILEASTITVSVNDSMNPEPPASAKFEFVP